MTWPASTSPAFSANQNNRVSPDQAETSCAACFLHASACFFACCTGCWAWRLWNKPVPGCPRPLERDTPWLQLLRHRLSPVRVVRGSCFYFGFSPGTRQDPLSLGLRTIEFPLGPPCKSHVARRTSPPSPLSAVGQPTPPFPHSWLHIILKASTGVCDPGDLFSCRSIYLQHLQAPAPSRRTQLVCVSVDDDSISPRPLSLASTSPTSFDLHTDQIVRSLLLDKIQLHSSLSLPPTWH